MALRQIPKALMPDTIEVFVPVAGEYGGTFSEDALVIKNVRLERKSGMNVSSYVQMNGTFGKLFIDAVNSEGAFYIPIGSKVLLNGSNEKHIVTKVECFEGFNGKVHHWEVQIS